MSELELELQENQSLDLVTNSRRTVDHI